MTTRKPTDVRRTEIADAALRVVATRGIAALSTRVLAEAVGVWERASLQMHQACRARGVPYLHPLQPNQYVPGSKPLDAQERANAYREGGLQQNVAWGYPLLFDAIPRIEAGGIEFHDLTRIFVDRQEPIYVDVCCHYNRAGNVVLARSIVEQLRIDPGGR